MPKKSSDLARILAYFDSAPPEQAWDLLACLRERVKARNPQPLRRPKKKGAIPILTGGLTGAGSSAASD